MLVTEKESVFLKTLPMWAMGFAQIRLSKTMLDKSIIDANKSVRDLALNFGIDFDKMKNGDKYEVLARFDDTNQESVVRFYKTINRGDRRVSIKGIKQYASIGDLIALSACLPKDDNKDIIIINVTRRADDE
jgi:hypothetical protein|tara:strand:+ start:3131 stop:3526 length:396 start_codon:yes stop_codon:yes gene_type:complete